jgi:uncharacterized protein (DUF302 family)
MDQYSISTAVKPLFERALRETHQALQDEEFVVITEIDLQAELAKKRVNRFGPTPSSESG